MSKFDLQLFAENSAPAAAEPQGQTEGAVEVSAEPAAFDYENATRDQRREAVMSYFTEPEPAEPPAPGQQATPDSQEPTEPEQEPPAEIPQKFLNFDGTPNIDALVKSYVNAEKKIGEQGNRIGQQNQQVQELMQKIRQLEQAQTQQPAQTQEEVVLEQGEFNSDQWFEKFYENPKEALQELFQGTVKDAISPQLQALEPVVRHFQQQQERAFWESRVGEVQQKYSDFENYREKAAEILQQQPVEFLNLPNAVEAAYLMAKAQVLDAEKAAQPKLEDMVKDPAFLQQLSKNPELQKLVLKSYSEEISKEPKPAMIGSHPGSAAPATPPPEIRSVKDATRAFKSYLMGG